MCIIIGKLKGKEFDKDKVEFSYKSNKDGCGVMWFENGEVKTYKTLDFEEFKSFLDTKDWLKEFNAVIHLRYTTVGENTVDNLHPFDIGGGVMMHNGTIYSFKPKDKDSEVSDSFEFAKALNDLSSGDHLQDHKMYGTKGFSRIIKDIIGTHLNRVVIMNKHNGAIHLFNATLGESCEGLWYSNDYYKKERVVTKTYNKVEDDDDDVWTTYFNDKKKKYTPLASVALCNKVFVYGTLKRGFINHGRLSKASKLGNAKTVHKWAMIGKGKPFPYAIRPSELGYHIKGEVYDLDSVATMGSLDKLEGYPWHYDKKVIEVELEDGTKTKAWIYFDDDQTYFYKDLIEEFTKQSYSVSA